ncbi:hypothetical protein DFH94DRAFT_725742 [Russula ochroleuca]|jgi:hypothetical protein|uniref:Uncharacterized protein n=1 Tax=Russula ochroleuca TaxID=152965 RepID=A0A9P5N1R6_9AGAM|nr:hypothetical protein DFH94DRAFT_725742 [Russula ochroleuca]
MRPLDGDLEACFCFGSRYYSSSYSWLHSHLRNWHLASVRAMHQLANSIHALALQVLKGPSLYSVSLNRATDAAEMPYSLLGIHSNSDTSLADPLSEFAFSGPLQRVSRLPPTKVFPTEGPRATAPSSKIDSPQDLAPFAHLVHADPVSPSCPQPPIPNRIHHGYRRVPNLPQLPPAHRHPSPARSPSPPATGPPPPSPNRKDLSRPCLGLRVGKRSLGSPTPAWRPSSPKSKTSGLDLVSSRHS